MSRPIPPTTAPWQLSKEKETNSTERLLLEAVERMEAYREGRVAVHIHLSRLQHHHRKENYLRIATDTFEAQVKSYAGHIFVLTNGDLFFIGKDVRMSSLIECVDRLRLLFTEDPLAHYTEDEEQGGFATYYDFTENYDILHQDVIILVKAAERLRKHKETGGHDPKAGRHGRLLQPGDLVKLIATLERADISNIIRTQTACRLDEAGLPRPIFKEYFVSIDALQNVCAPDIDLLSDRWLFHYLSRTLDKRVLAMMSSNGIDPVTPFSLNLNVSTLLSPEFNKFDEHVPATLRGQVVIEIHKLDIFSDIGAFIFARDLLQKRGYRLCLDGLTHHTLPFFDHHTLGLDLFKIYWGAEGLKTALPASLEDISARLKGFSSSRIILCRCENEDAIAMGRKLGINQFQGLYIDRLLGNTRSNK
jgi:hypothetical protein